MRDHTPGPWFVVQGDEWTDNIATDTPEQGIWTVASANSRRAEFHANKRLIAAAPEMIEALQMVMEGHEEGELLERALPFVKAAIAKATAKGK